MSIKVMKSAETPLGVLAEILLVGICPSINHRKAGEVVNISGIPVKVTGDATREEFFAAVAEARLKPERFEELPQSVLFLRVELGGEPDESPN